MNGDWGLGIGDWDWGLEGLGPIPNPLIPNPQSPTTICMCVKLLFKN